MSRRTRAADSRTPNAERRDSEYACNLRRRPHTTVAGRDSHPLGNGAFARRTEKCGLVLWAALAAEAGGQQLLEIDGIELRGVAQIVQSGGGTCNVQESDTRYEEKRANHGARMDIWRLDFSVRNSSGRWLDHLIARFQIEAEWPECTNWDVPDAATLATQYPSAIIEWGGSIGHIQESGRNVVSPGETLTDTKLLIVLRGDPQPRFSNWSMEFDFAVNPPPAGAGSSAGTPTGSAELDALFWQSIMNSTNPTEFEAYLTQFPNGVFRSLAEARLAALRERPDGPAAGGSPRGGSTADAPADAQRPTSGWSIEFGDDAGEFARDGECDDPRFEGAGMGIPTGNPSHRGRDATDCRELYDEGRIRLFGVDLDSGSIDFGDDANEWPLDGMCEDPRFDGSSGDSIALSSGRGHDATDCRALYDAGRLHLFGINVGAVR